MPKIKTIIKIEKKKQPPTIPINDLNLPIKIIGYNQGQSDLGDRAIELDGNKMRDIMIDELAKAPFSEFQSTVSSFSISTISFIFGILFLC